MQPNVLSGFPFETKFPGFRDIIGKKRRWKREIDGQRYSIKPRNYIRTSLRTIIKECFIRKYWTM